MSDVLAGQSFPLGATVYPDGVNFCVFSKNAIVIELLLYDDPDQAKPSRVIRLDQKQHKTFYYWHVFVKNIKAGQIYAYRASGLFIPEKGLRFDRTKVLLDPYAKAVVYGDNYNRAAAILHGDNSPFAFKGVVVDNSTYDWEGDRPLQTPYNRTVIYELHVGGFTRHPNSGLSPNQRGTYRGLIEKIPYLQEIGITAVELMPIHQFDPQDARPNLTNYWGYSPVAFFAPHREYSSDKSPLGPVNEFRDMVKAFHKAGIEVILDVVFNHTAEGNENGPTMSFKGLENKAYYILEEDQRYYKNYSGCGNTLSTNHSIVRRLIIDSLRYWVYEMHVDGFRFDLASVLSRGENGEPLENPPILWSIESEPVLAGTKLIAEAWDAAGLYQVGSFIGDRFAEWNGKYRDDVRRFVKGDEDSVVHLASRIIGSPDIYDYSKREITRSIHFVTCHDGFTLNDLVSYNEKHNLDNGEKNNDGANDNFSWNCGEEGVTKKYEIESLRLQQIKNFFTITLFSQGTPMLLMGDEIRRSQLGNNNAYCQDNKISWFDWSGIESNAGLLRFVKGLINFTQSLAILQFDSLLDTTHNPELPHIIWHGVSLGEPDWGNDSHSLAFTLSYPRKGERLHVMLNAYWESLNFQLPTLPIREYWHRIVDTSLPSPNDYSDPPVAIKGEEYRVVARSSVVLMSLPIWGM